MGAAASRVRQRGRPDRAVGVPSCAMSDSNPTPRRPLPDHLRRIVAEIESEIGEDDAFDHGDPGTHGKAAFASPGGIDTPQLAQPPTPVAGSNGRIEGAVREILSEIGEDPEREGLRATPDRMHRMYHELTVGYHVNPERLINDAVFEVGYSEMVVVKEIPFYSLCEHHLLPFFGSAHVAYVPDGRVIGLSKIPRIVEMYARRLQVQERMTQQIADFLMERLGPKGVGVVLEATHLCASMRGVRKPGTVMTTAAVLGLFRRNDKTRAEFFAHLGRPGPGA
jgi:GTP cyclohydrolase IA